MYLRLPDSGSFEDLLRPTRIEVASLVRLSRHPATEPYWSAGVYRFDDPHPGGADAFGTCYTASTIEVAFAESVIHECGRFVAGRYEVPSAEVTERSVVRYSCERRKTLVLADLTGAALKATGDPRCESALGWNSVRVAANEQGVCLRHLRAQRAPQAARREAEGAAGG